jgi:penicillin-binding protein 2
MEESQHFKDHQRELSLFRSRLIVMLLVILCLMGTLLYRYYDLQILNYED